MASCVTKYFAQFPNSSCQKGLIMLLYQLSKPLSPRFPGLASKPEKALKTMRLHGQAVKTSPFHGGNTGSIPVGVI